MRTAMAIIGIAAALAFAVPVSAAKPRIRTKPAGSSTAVGAVSYSTVKISRPSHSIILSLTNLSSVKKVSYELSYSARGIPQGAMGAVTVSGQSSDSRDLYFGTCSHGVCTPHTDVTDATLTVKVTKNNGTVAAKRYRINTRF
jgi:hypothetical protein